MKKNIYSASTITLCVIFSVLFTSCNGSSSCGDSDEARVEYRVEIGAWKVECLTSLEWIDKDGVLRGRTSLNTNPWKEIFCGLDGAHLYLSAGIECDEVTISLYLNDNLVERKTRDYQATINGYLRIDDDGNATFEDKAD